MRTAASAPASVSEPLPQPWWFIPPNGKLKSPPLKLFLVRMMNKGANTAMKRETGLGRDLNPASNIIALIAKLFCLSALTLPPDSLESHVAQAGLKLAVALLLPPLERWIICASRSSL